MVREYNNCSAQELTDPSPKVVSLVHRGIHRRVQIIYCTIPPPLHEPRQMGHTREPRFVF